MFNLLLRLLYSENQPSCLIEKKVLVFYKVLCTLVLGLFPALRFFFGKMGHFKEKKSK